MREDFLALKEHLRERRDKKQESRKEYFLEQWNATFTPEVPVEIKEYDDGYECFIINVRGQEVRFFPYTGWFQGKKNFGNGRGIKNFFKRMEKCLYS